MEWKKYNISNIYFNWALIEKKSIWKPDSLYQAGLGYYFLQPIFHSDFSARPDVAKKLIGPSENGLGRPIWQLYV
jgi:hypothetical protein